MILQFNYSNMTRKISMNLMAVFAIIVGLYPTIYFLIDRKFGLLNSKTNELLVNSYWNIAFYTHIILGGLALLLGWTQFNSNIRNRYLILHKRIGKIYIVTVILSSISGIYIGIFATGGLLSSLGFLSLGIIWLTTTIKAYASIRSGLIKKHQTLMVYSYAACFAAVTLRIWLPLLIVIFGNFMTAYIIVAWLCWIPNLLVAHYFIVPQIERSKI